MSLKIRINNLNRKRRINHKYVKRAATLVLRERRIKDALIDITFTGNRKIRKLNEKYMGKSGPTDVLAFPLEGGRGLREKGGSRSRKTLVGDIYVSTDMAVINARRFGSGLQKELLLYVIHGILHLLGFGDKKAGEKRRIRKLEERLLKKAVGSL